MLNISLPDQVQAFVEERAIAAASVLPMNTSITWILRERERIAQQERIESLLLKGLESEEPVAATDDGWEQKRIQLVERFCQSDA
jgi:antitoxin ParD1/3/4